MDSWTYKNWSDSGLVTIYQQGKPRVEIRTDSLSGDGSQSWIRISNGLNKFVRDLTDEIQTLYDDSLRDGNWKMLSNKSRQTCSEAETKADSSETELFLETKMEQLNFGG